jgi:hypothetical protein
VKTCQVSQAKKEKKLIKKSTSMLFAHKALGHGLYHNWALDLGWALIPIKPVATGFTLTKMKELIKTLKHYINIYIYIYVCVCNNLVNLLCSWVKQPQ